MTQLAGRAGHRARQGGGGEARTRGKRGQRQGRVPVTEGQWGGQDMQQEQLLAEAAQNLLGLLRVIKGC